MTLCKAVLTELFVAIILSAGFAFVFSCVLSQAAREDDRYSLVFVVPALFVPSIAY